MKFLNFFDNAGKKIRRYQYTIIDDVTRGRALKICKYHNQANATDFVDSFLEKFPFRIDGIDIAKKLSEWEIFYNCHRPNAALKGKTPYEVLKERLSLNNNSFSNPPPKNNRSV